MRIGILIAAWTLVVASWVPQLAPPASAATLTFTDANCADFSLVNNGSGNFQVTCNFVSVPVCQLTTTNATPTVGSSITLTAACTGSPFGWLFTGTASPCSTTQSSCQDTQANAGPVTYTVLGGNAAGRGPVGSVTVNWQALSVAQAPTCQNPTVSPSTLTSAGGAVTLGVACTASSAISYSWTRTAPSAQTLSSNSAASGAGDTAAANTGVSSIIYTYNVQACTSASACTTKSLSFNVPGSATPPVTTGFCGQYTDVLFVNLPWGGFVNPSGFKAAGVLVGVLTVPSTASFPTSATGILSATEYGDPPTDRTATLSTQACDFGQGGAGVTLKTVYGQQPNVLYSVNGATVPSLVPGTTYYFNIRNFSRDLQRISCTTATCNVQLDVNLPR